MSITSLALRGPAQSQADIFFDRNLVETPWDAIRQMVEDKETTSARALEWLKKAEPLPDVDPGEHTHWRHQQVLRLALLHEAVKPLELETTCQCCGSRKADPLFKEMCLHCRERDRQLYSGGSRGSCEYVQVKFNHLSRCWGLLYYWSSHENTFILWLADYYKSRQDAEMALYPVKLYSDWLDAKYKGMLSVWNVFRRLIDIEETMRMKLPLGPDEFRAILRSKIEADMVLEHDVMGYDVRNAMKEHERDERD